MINYLIKKKTYNDSGLQFRQQLCDYLYFYIIILIYEKNPGTLKASFFWQQLVYMPSRSQMHVTSDSNYNLFTISQVF